MAKDNFFKGFDAFGEELSLYLKYADNASEALEVGVKEFVSDMNKLPKPRSIINQPGYTHLLDSINYKTENKNILVGWGKYYGPIVESRKSHLVSTYESKHEKYEQVIINKLLNSK